MQTNVWYIGAEKDVTVVRLICSVTYVQTSKGVQCTKTSAGKKFKLWVYL